MSNSKLLTPLQMAYWLLTPLHQDSYTTNFDTLKVSKFFVLCELYTNYRQLKLYAVDGKPYLTDVIDMFRIKKARINSF